ncbi:hypothetical protein C8F01DRAFT_667316 [Mycena amicta]|nr:hypothetical protein C8F01DRAFT_667316 [Mycena amicta]
MMSYGWLFADIQQPNRWVQVTTPLFHPPLVSSPIPIPDHPHAGLSTPKPKKISVSKRDEANAIMEPKFKWPLSIGLGRRVSNLFRSPRDDAAEGRGAVKSNPERISRASTSHPSAKGKGKEAVPPLPPDDLPTTSRRGRGMFGTWRSGQDGGRASAARHSVEALGNTRVASAAVAAATSSSDGASGGVMLGSRSGTVTVVGGSGSGTHPLSISNEQRTSSLSNARPNSSSGPWAVNREWPQDPNADNSNEDEDLVRDGTLIGVGVGMGLIVMPRRLRDDIGSASASSHSGSSRSPSVGDYGDIDDDGHAPGPDDSDWGDEDHDYRRRDVYGETSSGDEDDEEGPIEFKRRVRPEPRGPGHGHDDAGAGD